MACILLVGLTVQTVQKTGDSTVQFWMVVDMPVGAQTTGLWFRQCRKLWLPQVQCSDKVGRPCEGASDSVLAGFCGHFSCHRDEFAFSLDGGVDGALRGFCAFFVLLQVFPELSAMPISTAFVDIHIRLTLVRV